MNRYCLRGIPRALGAISLPHLLALLEPHREFFVAKGLRLENRKELFDYEALLSILVDDRSGTPDALLDAIQMIGEMSSPEAMDRLLDEAHARDIPIEGLAEPTPADIAAQLFLSAREVLDREYVTGVSVPLRRYFYFRAAEESALAPMVPPADLPARLDRALDGAFVSRERGRLVRVAAFPSGPRVEYFIRRGGCNRRMPVVREGRASSVVVRPERHDVIVYDPAAREIAISADDGVEVALYREILGRELFGSERAFQDRGRFDLSPLRLQGRKALACGDVEGIRSVTLSELAWQERGEKSIRIQQGTDLFRETRGLGRSLKSGVLLGATFSVTYGSRPIVRRLRIRPTNVAEYPFTADTTLFDDWLTRRGFLRPGVCDASHPATCLASC